MPALIDQKVYNDLLLTRTKVLAEADPSAAEVFVPVGPLPGASHSPRLLFIGQATMGWDPPQDFSKSTDASLQLLSERLADPGTSRFWAFVLDVASQVFRLLGRRVPDDLSEFVGWSNMFKIGAARGNPNAPSARLQAFTSIQTLQQEISLMRPTATIITTGGTYKQKEVFFPAFGDDGWSGNSPDEDKISVKEHPKLGLLVWSDHPRTLEQAGVSKEVRATIAAYVAATARYRDHL